MKKHLGFLLATLFASILTAQQPQTQTAPLFAANAKYANGAAPGYWPTAGAGLTLNVSGGTAFCAGSVATYSNGTLTMTASTTNYVYLNTASSCVPAVKTSAFTTGDIPIAQVVTSGSAITSIADVRTPFSFGASGGTSPLTTKGDLFGYSTAAARIPVGTDTYVLTADSTQALGLKWSAPSGGTSTNGAQTWPALNGGTGTGVNLLAGWANLTNDSNFAKTFPVPSAHQGGTNINPGILGICVSNCGTSGIGSFQYQGSVQWICDNIVGVGDWVGPSPTTAGQCHDPVIVSGVNSQQVNEDPEFNSAIGIVLAANPSIGTAATIALMPHMGYGQTIFGGYHGQGFALTSIGSPFTSTSFWNQAPGTANGDSFQGQPFAFSGHHPIDLWNPSGAGYCFIDNGDLGKGVTTHDFGIDCLTNGFGSPPGQSMYFNVSTYTKPTALTCTGTVGVVVTQTSGVFSCTLTGNTTFSTPTSDNIGHEITYDLKQAAGSAFTVTWPGNFVNAPTMTTTLSASTVAKFYFDGTNYTCTGGCASSGGGTGFPITLGSTSIASGSTTTAVTGLSVNGVPLTTGGSATAFLNGAGGYTTPAGAGTVTSFSAGTLSPLFTTSVATATSTPALTFTLSNAAAHSFLGNGTGSSAAPAYSLLGTNDWSPNAYVAGAGSVNVMTATLSPAATALVAGLEVNALPNLANTTTTPTLNVSGLGAKTITKNGTAALAVGDYTTTAIAKFIYDGTEWQLQNPQTTSGGGGGVTAIGVTTANGVSGTSSGGSTPSLTITLGAITPTTVNGATVAVGGFSNSSLVLGNGGAVGNIQNTSVGVGVGSNLGNQSTVMGYNVMGGAGGGSGTSTAFGQSALSSGNNAVFQNVDGFGAGAGSSTATSVSNSVFVGFNAIAGGGGAISNVVCIGQSQTCGTNNTATLGNASTTSTILRGLVQAPGIESSGTKFTTSGCSVSSTTGGGTAGIFTLGANSCTVVITMNGATGLTANTGWTCQAHDRTAPTILIGGESSSTTTTASIIIPAGAGSTDIISFSCEAF